MTDYLVDENFDIVLPLTKITDPATLLFQQVRLLLETFTGDFPYDATAGMPYDEAILSGGDVNVAELESIYYKKISALAYFGSIKDFSITLTASRNVQITFTVVSTTGEAMEFGFIAEEGIGDAPINGILYARRLGLWEDASIWISNYMFNTPHTFTEPISVSSSTLSHGVSITPNFDAASDFFLATTSGAFTIENPTGGAVGQSGDIIIDLTDAAPSWGTFWNFGRGGIPVALYGTLLVHYYVHKLEAGGIICTYQKGY